MLNNTKSSQEQMMNEHKTLNIIMESIYGSEEVLIGQERQRVVNRCMGVSVGMWTKRVHYSSAEGVRVL